MRASRWTRTVLGTTAPLLGFVAGAYGAAEDGGSILGAWPTGQFALGVASAATASHGPTTSAGAGSAWSGETLREGGFEVGFRLDFTTFDDVSRAEAEARAGALGDEFDSIENALLVNLAVAFGITPDLQVGAQLGYYLGEGFINAEDGAPPTSAIADPSGLTDLWITLKARVVKVEGTSVALMGGVKIPVGKDDAILDDGRRLEPSSQPSSGAFDFLLGAAATHRFDDRWVVEGGIGYTLRLEHDDFKVGDRIDAGIGVGYMVYSPGTDVFPQISLTAGADLVHLFKNEESGVSLDNTGGTTIYLGPGVHIQPTHDTYITLSPMFPVYQDLNGDQVETRFRLGLAAGWRY